MPRLLVLLLLVPLAVGCSTSEPAGDWSLVGMYDGAALSRLAGADAASGFAWQADRSVEEWCGRPKGPLGYGGAMDVELMARGRMPYLALVLAGPASGTLTTEDLAVFVDVPEPSAADPQARSVSRTPLAPAVVPRRMEVVVRSASGTGDRDAVQKMTRQLQAQLTVQLCLEHQAGRAWTGIEGDGRAAGGSAAMQNIFMLDEVDDETRRLFVGQGTSIAPLLGPPSWTPQWLPASTAPAVVTGRQLRSADLFAFRAPAAVPNTEAMSAVYEPLRAWPDEYAHLEAGGVACQDCRRELSQPRGVTRLELTVEGSPEHLADAGALGLTANWAVRRPGGIADPRPRLWKNGEQVDISPSTGDQEQPVRSLPDVLGALPYDYPRLLDVWHAGADRGETQPPRHALTVLLIPNWQLINARDAIARIGQASPPRTAASAQDGVGWILEHPELLHVQHIQSAAGADGTAKAFALGPASPPKQDKADEGWTLPASPRFGASPDFRALAAPAVALGAGEVTTRMQRQASRAGLDHLVLLGLIVLLVILIPGLARVPNLWSVRPRERAWGWPSRKQRGLVEVIDKASGGEGGA